MKYKIIALVSVCSVLCACQNSVNKQMDNQSYALAVNKGNTENQKVKYVPVPMPGQFMPLKTKKPVHLTGEAAIEAANKKSTKQANSGKYINSIMNFDYMPGALYQIYCAPYSVTDVQFQNNEHIVAVGAGDTARWQVTKSYSGVGATRQEHLFIKPTEDSLNNSIVVTTDLRTYHLMLMSTSKTYMASVTWRYPEGDNGMLIENLDDESAENPIDLANAVDTSNLRFNYQLRQLTKSGKPDWYPRMVFNDGKKTYIKFPPNMQETPNLLIGIGGKTNQVTNYRLQGDYYVLDSVVYYAQLCGGPEGKTVIQIEPKGR